MDARTTIVAGAQRRVQQREAARQARLEHAWEVARNAAAFLKEHYGARRVAVFGSLRDPEHFHNWSDIDLAVWGMAPADYYEAVARVLDLAGEIGVDLVQAEKCPPSLQFVIEQGVEL